MDYRDHRHTDLSTYTVTHALEAVEEDVTDEENPCHDHGKHTKLSDSSVILVPQEEECEDLELHR